MGTPQRNAAVADARSVPATSAASAEEEEHGRGAAGGGGTNNLLPPPSSLFFLPSSTLDLPRVLDAARRASATVAAGEAAARRRWAALPGEALAREVDALRADARTLAAAVAALGGGGGGGAGAVPPAATAAAATTTHPDWAALLSARPAPAHAAAPSSHGREAPAGEGDHGSGANDDPGAPKSNNADDTTNHDDDDEDEWRVPPHCVPIRADVRTFDWPRLAAAAQFDVVLMDPPWQLATANPTRGVALGYSQLADADILRLPVPTLQRRGGFLFVWVINAKYKFTLDLLDAWGYALVDEIVWVKSTVNRRLAKSHGYYLQHAKETCLVLAPMPWELAVAARMRGGGGKQASPFFFGDTLFSERRGQSQKPLEMYDLVESLVPEGRYLEIFARRNNLRDGWVSIGNET